MGTFYIIRNDLDLYHHGILGQKWGVRRFQNKDGSLTKAGQKRYTKAEAVKNRELSLLKGAKQDYEEQLERTKKMKDYDTYRKTLIEDEFGDDAKDEKILKSTLKEYEVKDVDEFFEAYYGQSLKDSYNDFMKNDYAYDIKHAQDMINLYSKHYDKVSDIDIGLKSDKEVRKEIRNIERST